MNHESVSPFHADWLVPQWPAPWRVRAVCTTRAGGVSASPYDSLNLGTHVGDDPIQVARNRQILQACVDANPVFLAQVHGTRLAVLPQAPGASLQVDGAYTRQTGVACTVMVADCLPVLLCDMQCRQVAALHAGWRGLAGAGGSGILEEALKVFQPSGPAGPGPVAAEVVAWMGPCIGPRAFEVGDDVRQAFVAHMPDAEQAFQPVSPGKWLADLPGLARRRLQALGVHGVYGNDGTDAWCTVRNPSRFFSHRRDRVSGRMAACIWLV